MEYRFDWCREWGAVVRRMERVVQRISGLLRLETRRLSFIFASRRRPLSCSTARYLRVYRRWRVFRFWNYAFSLVLSRCPKIHISVLLFYWSIRHVPWIRMIFIFSSNVWPRKKGSQIIEFYWTIKVSPLWKFWPPTQTNLIQTLPTSLPYIAWWRLRTHSLLASFPFLNTSALPPLSLS